MSLFVQMFVIRSLVNTMTFWRYHRNRSIRLDNRDKSVRIVPLALQLHIHCYIRLSTLPPQLCHVSDRGSDEFLGDCLVRQL